MPDEVAQLGVNVDDHLVALARIVGDGDRVAQGVQAPADGCEVSGLGNVDTDGPGPSLTEECNERAVGGVRLKESLAIKNAVVVAIAAPGWVA